MCVGDREGMCVGEYVHEAHLLKVKWSDTPLRVHPARLYRLHVCPGLKAAYVHWASCRHTALQAA